MHCSHTRRIVRVVIGEVPPACMFEIGLWETNPSNQVTSEKPMVVLTASDMYLYLEQVKAHANYCTTVCSIQLTMCVCVCTMNNHPRYTRYMYMYIKGIAIHVHVHVSVYTLIPYSGYCLRGIIICDFHCGRPSAKNKPANKCNSARPHMSPVGNDRV